MKKSLEIPRAKATMQMLEELVKKYEKHRDKKYDNDLKWQRLYDFLPKPIEPQLVLEDRDRSATCESVKPRANNWMMMKSTGRADMDLGTMGNEGDHDDSEGGEELDSSGGLMGPKGGRKSAGKVQHNGYFYQCGQWRQTAKNWGVDSYHGKVVP